MLRNRPFTELETMFCLTLDSDNNNQVTISGYAQDKAKDPERFLKNDFWKDFLEPVVKKSLTTQSSPKPESRGREKSWWEIGDELPDSFSFNLNTEK